jgi:predicted AlkP superfamily phosphohydrolase/phosphomutase
LAAGRPGPNVSQDGVGLVSDPERLLIVGWDGADWDVLEPLMRDGYLPTLRAMAQEGLRGDLASTIPFHSWSAWSSFLTGMNPGRHGVYDFVEVDPREPRRRIPISSDAIKAPTFLERLSAAGQEVRAGNVPVTFPPFSISGRLISGVAIPPGAGFVHPPEWSHELERRAPFPINGMEWMRFKDRPGALIDEAKDFEERRTDSFLAMLEGEWSVAICVYVAPDRLQHPFARYLIGSHPDYQRLADSPLAGSIRDVYGSLDRHLDRLRSAAGRNATTIVLSDHGFRPVTRRVNPNALLVELGFQSMMRGAKVKTSLLRSSAGRALARTRAGNLAKRRVRAPSVIDWTRTIAYQSGTGFGVSVNLVGRQPNGVVPPSNFEGTRDEVRAALLSFKDPETGGSPVRAVWCKEELYEGPSAELAPDLIIEWNDLWDYQDDVGSLSMAVDWPSGDHRRRGILAAAGGRTVRGNVGVRDIADIAATALAYCGVSPTGLDGRPIPEITGDTGEERTVVVPARESQTLGKGDEDSIVQHLRGLGYIE